MIVVYVRQTTGGAGGEQKKKKNTKPQNLKIALKRAGTFIFFQPNWKGAIFYRLLSLSIYLTYTVTHTVYYYTKIKQVFSVCKGAGNLLCSEFLFNFCVEHLFLSITFGNCFYKVFLARKPVNFSGMLSGSWHCFYERTI